MSAPSLNRTSGVTFGGNSLALSYTATGKLAGETRSNGVQSVYGYDAAGQLASLSHKKGSTIIADLVFTRNDAGWVTGESGTLPLNPTMPVSNVTGAYSNTDGVSTWSGDSYAYDADGNLTAITGARTFSAAYDNQNRPTSITLGGTATNYLYDGLGNRVQAQTAAATRNFHHDPWGRLLFETDASGLITANYIYTGNRLVASGTTAYVFYHQDKTGNTLALTDSGGSVVGAFAYSPYGAVLGKSGAATTTFTFVGSYGVMSEGNDLYFMKNRYYDAVTGRFIQRDPIGFAGGQSNLYSYAGGNPVGNVDPIGLLGEGASMERFISSPISPVTREIVEKVTTYAFEKGLDRVDSAVGNLPVFGKVLLVGKIATYTAVYGYWGEWNTGLSLAGAEAVKGIIGMFNLDNLVGSVASEKLNDLANIMVDKIAESPEDVYKTVTTAQGKTCRMSGGHHLY